MKNKIHLITLLLFISLQLHAQQTEQLLSGPGIGEECLAFDPQHVTGPDKGKSTCPMCRYGNQQGVLIWMNSDSWDNIGTLASVLEAEIEKKGFSRIRVFLMYMNPEHKTEAEVEELLGAFAKKYRLNKVAVTHIPAPADEETAGLYSINPNKEVRNTVIVYKSRSVFNKVINFNTDEASVQKLVTSVEKAEWAKKL
jgi:protocatechuate 3,4-dioxygenase beta subunit